MLMQGLMSLLCNRKYFIHEEEADSCAKESEQNPSGFYLTKPKSAYQDRQWFYHLLPTKQ